MKSGLLAVCKHGIYELMALQTKTGRIFQAMISILHLFNAALLSAEAKGYSAILCKVYFAIYIWPFQQDSISRMKMSWEDIK